VRFTLSALREAPDAAFSHPARARSSDIFTAPAAGGPEFKSGANSSFITLFFTAAAVCGGRLLRRIRFDPRTFHRRHRYMQHPI